MDSCTPSCAHLAPLFCTPRSLRTPAFCIFWGFSEFHPTSLCPVFPLLLFSLVCVTFTLRYRSSVPEYYDIRVARCHSCDGTPSSSSKKYYQETDPQPFRPASHTCPARLTNPIPLAVRSRTKRACMLSPPNARQVQYYQRQAGWRTAILDIPLCSCVYGSPF
jgi:hypothetical protein